MNGPCIHILLAEDNDDDVTIMQDALAQVEIRFTLEVVRNGADALDCLWKRGAYRHTRTPDIAFLDIRMPKMDGIEIVGHMNSNPKLKTIPKILLTGVDDEDVVRHALHNGVDAYLFKPALAGTLREIFRKHLPATGMGTVRASADRAAAAGHKAARAESDGHALRPNTSILIVEDNEDDVLLIREAIGRAGISVRTDVVSDGESALAYLKRQAPFETAQRPDVILLDINMPGKNGVEVLHQIKADRSFARLPVIMLTTSTRDEDMVDTFAEGACLFLTKPSKFDEYKSILKVLSRYLPALAETAQP